MNQPQKQQLRRIDKTTGYLILLVLTTVIICVLSYGFYLIFRAEEIRYAQIDQISSLRISDPVKLNGSDIGRVSKITMLKETNKIIIQFKVTTPFDLHEGYYMRTGDVGIMGDRTIHILQGDTTKPLVSKDDTLNIEFVSGMSYLLGQAYKLPKMVQDWKNSAHLILRGSEKQKSVVKTLKTVGAELDTAVVYLYKSIKSIVNDDYALLDTINKVANETIKITDNLSDGLKNRLPQIDSSVTDLINFISKLDTMSINLINTTENLKNSKLIAEDDITPIINQLKNIKEVLNNIHEDCLKLRGVIRVGFKEKNIKSSK